jgi:hypothetical protein
MREIKLWVIVGIWFLALGVTAVTRAADASDDPFERPRPSQPAKQAAAPATPAVLAPPATEAEIRQKLAITAAPNYIEKPLQDVIHDLEKGLGIPVFLDKRALDNNGIGSDTPITQGRLPHSWKTALELIQRDLDLRAVVKDGTLLITTLEAAETMTEARVYDVTDLVCQGDGGPADAPDFDQLIDLVTRVIAPTTWDQVGGPGAVGSFQAAGIRALVVSQTQEVHGQIDDLLRQLRSIRRGPPPGGPAAPRPKDPPPPAGKPAAPPPPAAKISPAEKALRAALDKPITIEWAEVPLRDAVKRLEQLAGIEIVLRTKTLTESGVDVQTPLSLRANQLKLRQVLDLLARDHGVVWAVEQGTLLLTSSQQAATTVITRIYDLSSLPSFRNEAGGGVPDYARFAATLRAMLHPETWDQSGGAGSVVVYEAQGLQALTVRQTWQIHEELDDLIRQLHKARTKPLAKDDIDKLPPAPPREK